MTPMLLGLRTVIYAAPDLDASEVGEGIVTATVRTPHGAIVGFIYNPHFVAT
jgi:hypothetical protein